MAERRVIDSTYTLRCIALLRVLSNSWPGTAASNTAKEASVFGRSCISGIRGVKEMSIRGRRRIEMDGGMGRDAEKTMRRSKGRRFREHHSYQCFDECDCIVLQPPNSIALQHGIDERCNALSSKLHYHYTALHYTTLHCTVLHYTALYYTALHCTMHCTMHCTALHCTFAM